MYYEGGQRPDRAPHGTHGARGTHVARLLPYLGHVLECVACKVCRGGRAPAPADGAWRHRHARPWSFMALYTIARRMAYDYAAMAMAKWHLARG